MRISDEVANHIYALWVKLHNLLYTMLKLRTHDVNNIETARGCDSRVLDNFIYRCTHGTNGDYCYDEYIYQSIEDDLIQIKELFEQYKDGYANKLAMLVDAIISSFKTNTMRYGNEIDISDLVPPVTIYKE